MRNRDLWLRRIGIQTTPPRRIPSNDTRFHDLLRQMVGQHTHRGINPVLMTDIAAIANVQPMAAENNQIFHQAFFDYSSWVVRVEPPNTLRYDDDDELFIV